VEKKKEIQGINRGRITKFKAGWRTLVKLSKEFNI
jgi:hypothetical protein